MPNTSAVSVGTSFSTDRRPISLVSIKDSIRSILTATQDAEIWDSLLGFAGQFHVEHLWYYHLPPVGSLDFNLNDSRSRKSDGVQTPEIDFFLKQQAEELIPRLRKLEEPKFFTQFSDLLQAGKMPSCEVIDLHCSQGENGVVIPVHGVNGRNGVMILTFKDIAPKYFLNDILEIKWGCEAAHSAFSALKRKSNRTIKPLSRREKEVMTWAASGKSNTVIADILDISAHTVNGYLRSVFLKTGTSDRTTATLRCISESLL
jgi:DNA-binding CsgD family transcriptional regulator